MNTNAANTATPMDNVNPVLLKKVKIPRKFEIFVEEFDEEKGWKAVTPANIPGTTNSNPIITVDSPADMQSKINLYKSMDQRFRIIREIDPPSKETIARLAIEQGIDPETGEQIGAKKDGDMEPEPVKHANVQRNPPQNSCSPATNPECEQTKRAPKPKIITIGDLQIKYDGDKVYQKQWMKLTPAESANFRVVNDSNNKLVSLSGKHFEMKKWVLVEQDDASESDITEKLLDE